VRIECSFPHFIRFKALTSFTLTFQSSPSKCFLFFGRCLHRRDGAEGGQGACEGGVGEPRTQKRAAAASSRDRVAPRRRAEGPRTSKPRRLRAWSRSTLCVLHPLQHGRPLQLLHTWTAVDYSTDSEASRFSVPLTSNRSIASGRLHAAALAKPSACTRFQ
jgi:hypothetical protein